MPYCSSGMLRPQLEGFVSRIFNVRFFGIAQSTTLFSRGFTKEPSSEREDEMVDQDRIEL